MNTIKHRAENLNNGGSVTVYYCGYEKCEGGHFWGPAVRNQYLLHYVISGKGTYTVGEETYTLHANECFLIRPGERTYYIADREDPWEYMWVAFDGFDVLEILRRARHIGIDRTYLYRIFSASESMSPKQYLMQVRINAAKKMLLAGTYTVSETALSCGFSDSASFCGRFKRCTGMTPKEFVADSHKQKSSNNT